VGRVASPGEALDDADAGTVPGAALGGLPPGFGGPRERVRVLVSSRNLEQALVTCIADFQQQARRSVGRVVHHPARSLVLPHRRPPCATPRVLPLWTLGAPPLHHSGPLLLPLVPRGGLLPSRASPSGPSPGSRRGRLYTHEEGLRARLSFLLWAMQVSP